MVSEDKVICSTGGESDDNKSQSSCSNRRRNQIRASTSADTPRPVPPPVAKDPANIENVVPAVVVPPPVVVGGGSSVDDRKRNGKMWTEEEFSVYYEAVKLVGKDFDAIVRLMGKKKNCHRDKDQIRNYFFNCVKFVRNVVDIDMEDFFPELCRDAKELFLVINAGEWKKRTGCNKYSPDRMKELMFDGVTTIKANKKNLMLRTPSCPALAKYFTETRNIPADKFTSDVVIYLSPATHSDYAYVVACQQNPTVALRINANDRLSRIFELLNAKWRLRHAKDTKSIVLRPAISTEIGQVVVSEVSTETEQMSLNRLKKEMDAKNEKTSKRDASLSHNTVATYSAITPHPFTINEKMLINGIGADDVAEASVAELYCLCGMKSEFAMVYSIKSSRRRADGWQIFRELVLRDFGDQLTISREEESRTSADGKVDARRSSRQTEATSDRDASLDQPEAKRPRTDSQSGQKPPKVSQTRRVTRSTAPVPPPELVQCQIANKEDAAFMEQLNQMTQTRGNNTQNGKTRAKKKGKIQAPPTDLVPAAPMGRGFAPLYTPKQEKAQSRMSVSHPTDFSQMVSSSSGQQDMYVPVKTEHNSLGYTQFASGQDSLSKEMLYLCGAIPPRGMPTSEEVQNLTTTDSLFGEIGYSPMKTFVSLCSSDSIQKMAHSTMNEMMGQNSNDVFQEMRPLLSHVDDDGEQHWASNLSSL